LRPLEVKELEMHTRSHHLTPPAGEVQSQVLPHCWQEKLGRHAAALGVQSGTPQKPNIHQHSFLDTNPTELNTCLHKDLYITSAKP
jgi:hypothetical protein